MPDDDIYFQLSRYYDCLFPANQSHLAFIVGILEDAGATTVLDLGCGTGAYTLELARRGFVAEGVDLSTDLISRAVDNRKGLTAELEEAQPEAARRVAGTRFHQGDMTLFRPSSPASAVVCLRNTLPHVATRGAAARTLSAIYGYLAPGGVLITQTLNFDSLLVRLSEGGGSAEVQPLEKECDANAVVLHRGYKTDPVSSDDRLPRVVFTTAISVDGRMEDKPAATGLLALTAAAQRDLLQDAGFSEVSVFGDYRREDHSLSSPAIVCVAYREP